MKLIGIIFGTLLILVLVSGCEPQQETNVSNLIPESLQGILTPEQEQDYLAKLNDGTLDEDYLISILGAGVAGIVIAEIIDEVGDFYEKKHKKSMVKSKTVLPSSIPKYTPPSPTRSESTGGSRTAISNTPVKSMTPVAPVTQPKTVTKPASKPTSKRSWRPSFGRKRR